MTSANRKLRKQNHLRVEDVARFMGFETEQAVYKWQRGDSLPTIDNLYALSMLFDTPVDDILRGSREKDMCPSFSVFKSKNQSVTYLTLYFCGGIILKNTSVEV